MWEVLVGKIGTVYMGDNSGEAWKHYHAYTELSAELIGLGGGEDVSILHNGAIVAEYYGTNFYAYA